MRRLSFLLLLLPGLVSAQTITFKGKMYVDSLVVAKFSSISGGTGTTYAGNASIIYDGNSIPAGYGTSHVITSVTDFATAGPFPVQAQNQLKAAFPGATFTPKNFGVGGEQTPTMAANSAQVDNLFNPATYDRQIVIPFEMGNHICDGGATVQQAQDAYVAYCKARRAKGFLVVACTITARPGNSCSSMSGTEFENRRVQVNAWLRLHYLEFSDVLADVAGLTLSYNGDTHPDNAGAITIGNYVATKVGPLLTTGFNPQSIPFLLSGTTTTPATTTTGSGTTASGNTVLLVSGNGSNNSTTFTDGSGNNHTITAGGNAKISTDQAKYGGSSIFTDGGTGSKLSVATAADLNTGTNDFTLEGFIWPIQPYTTPYRTMVTKRSLGSTQEGFLVILFEDNTLHYFASANNSASPSSWDLIQSTTWGTANYSTWSHWAVVRSGNTWSFYMNGVLGSSQTVSGVVNASTFPLLIGGDGDGEYVNAYQHIRLSKVALYSGSTYTVPASF